MTGNDADFARWMGVNISTVSRARKAGRLVLTGDGRVEFEASSAQWHQTSGGRTDVAARHAAHRGSVIPMAHPRDENATVRDSARDAGLDAATGDGETRRNAKVALLPFENSAIKLEMALRRGLRLERAAIKREAHGLGAMLRAGVERVIDHTAPRLAAADSDLQRRQIVDAEIRRLRWIIKRELPRALRRMKEAGKAGTEA